MANERISSSNVPDAPVDLTGYYIAVDNPANESFSKVPASDIYVDAYTEEEVDDLLDLKANLTSVLTKTNVTTYNPTSDYHPATLKTVLSRFVYGGGSCTLDATHIVTGYSNINAYQLGALLIINGYFRTDGTDGPYRIATLPSSVNAPVARYYAAAVGSQDRGTKVTIGGAGTTNEIWVQDNTDSGLNYYFNIQCFVTDLPY